MNKTKANSKFPIARAILEALLEVAEMAPLPFETPYAYIRRAGKVNRDSYGTAVRSLKRRGMIEIAEKSGKKFLALTGKGQLHTLLQKAALPDAKKWDGKWRLVMFDIPEKARSGRDQLRYLLHSAGYKKIQASVFVSPYPINREGITFLNKTGLINYIRIFRIDEVDDENDLLHMFKLKK